MFTNPLEFVAYNHIIIHRSICTRTCCYLEPSVVKTPALAADASLDGSCSDTYRPIGLLYRPTESFQGIAAPWVWQTPLHARLDELIRTIDACRSERSQLQQLITLMYM